MSGTGNPAGNLSCPGCLAPGVERFFDFPEGPYVRCKSCGLLFGPGLQPQRHDGLDRGAVVTALQPLRESNFSKILDRLEKRLPAGARILEVGSSTGVFLEMAARRGFDVYGIEPDGYFVRISQERYPQLAERVMTGYFPDACPSGQFDAVCFNDVFEHIPGAERIMAQARDRLTPTGCVSLSIPASEGFFFHLATLGYRLGYHFLLIRMLQLEYPFPHLYYFSRRSMAALAGRMDMRVEQAEPLQILTADSIAARFAMDRDHPPGGGFVVALARFVFAFHRILPASVVKPDLLHFIVSRS
jgi:SAM-dependent methyltransferase